VARHSFSLEGAHDCPETVADDRPELTVVVVLEPVAPASADPVVAVASDEELVRALFAVVRAVGMRPPDEVAECAVVSEATSSPRPAAPSVATAAALAVRRRTRVIARARPPPGALRARFAELNGGLMSSSFPVLSSRRRSIRPVGPKAQLRPD
jgi:hypothetical protein